MERQQILNEYEKMRAEIFKSKDEYLEEIFKYLKSYFNLPKEEWDWEIFFADLENLIFESLEKTYSITAKWTKTIYGIDFKEVIDKETLEDLTYSKDGKSLEERIKKHYDVAIGRANVKDYLYNRIVLIMDTETLYVSNHVIHGKLKKYATHVEVVGVAECTDNSGLCETYVNKGKIPIEELEELPPYHPDCECEVVYYIEEKVL